MCSCENRGAGWNWSVTGTRQQKKMVKKKVDKKNKLFGTTFFFNDKSINNQSDIQSVR